MPAALPAAPAIEPKAPLSPEHAELWGRVVRTGGAGAPVLRAVFAETSLAAVEPGRVVLVCSTARFAASARARERQIAEIFERELGRRVDVVVEAGPAPAESPDAAPSAGPAADAPGAEPSTAHASPLAPAAPGADPGEHPLVKTAIELLGARIVSVQPRHHQ